MAYVRVTLASQGPKHSVDGMLSAMRFRWLGSVILALGLWACSDHPDEILPDAPGPAVDARRSPDARPPADASPIDAAPSDAPVADAGTDAQVSDAALIDAP